MNRGFQVFDTHTHVGTARHSGRSFRADQLIACMDRFGVDRSLVIPFPVVEDYRATHNEIGRAVAAYPDRLIGAACVDPFIPEQAVCPNIYLELSSLMPHHLADVLAHVPSSRPMIGSDLPESLETEISKILTLETAREVKADILWNTAAQLFTQAS